MAGRPMGETEKDCMWAVCEATTLPEFVDLEMQRIPILWPLSHMRESQETRAKLGRMRCVSADQCHVCPSSAFMCTLGSGGPVRRCVWSSGLI